MCVCVCVGKHATAHGDILLPVFSRILRHHSDGEDTACTHADTHARTHLFLRFYSTEDRENKILPPSTSTHTSPAGRALLLNSLCQQSPSVSQTLHLSQNYCTDRHCGFNLSKGRVVRERGKYKSLILSHKMYTCTHDFNAHRQTRRVRRLRTHTHSLRQFVTLNVFKKYR